MESSDGVQLVQSPRVAAGWDVRAKAGKIADELLAPTGTRVQVVGNVTNLIASDRNSPEWLHQLWERLRARHQLDGVDAALILRQNAIDTRGQQHAPAADFLSSGLIGLTAGAANRDERFQPSFLLTSAEGLNGIFESSTCSIGFDAWLLDAKSGKLLSQKDAVMGQEPLPDTFHAYNWDGLRMETAKVAETYCIAALRRAISQAINELNLVSR